MPASGRLPGGWALVGWTAVAAGLLVAAILAVQGTGPAGLHPAMRWSARLSGTLFLLAFSASSLRTLWRSDATAWLLANRRYVGVSFAVAHAWHLSVVLAFLRLPETQVELFPLLLGGLAVLLLAAMVATSFDRSAAWLGRRRWKVLHTTGSWVLWGVFAFTWSGAAALHPLSGLFAALALAAVGLRVAAALARRRAPA